MSELTEVISKALQFHKNLLLNLYECKRHIHSTLYNRESCGLRHNVGSYGLIFGLNGCEFGGYDEKPRSSSVKF